MGSLCCHRTATALPVDITQAFFSRYQSVSQSRVDVCRRSDDVPAPQAKDGEVLVDVYAAGLNFFE